MLIDKLNVKQIVIASYNQDQKAASSLQLPRLYAIAFVPLHICYGFVAKNEGDVKLSD
jgi:hypothetical protein